MKLKSYFNPNAVDTIFNVQIRLATDAAPAAPFVALGDLTHEPVNDNASGMQKLSISHVIYQHVQEQLYRQYKIQDIQRVKITNAAGYIPVTSFYVDKTNPVVKPGETVTLKAMVLPANATVDGFYISASNPALVSVAAGASANEFVVTIPNEGDVILNIGVKNTQLFESIPVSAQTVTRATY